jgi:type VI secretion system protein ImpJ
MTIATAARPLWSEGMLMCPQHMQQQDLYHEQLLDTRLQALTPAPWGVQALHFDLPALQAGNLQLAGFRGVLPDGTPLRFDAVSATRPAARAIGPHFPAKATAVPVYLGLPLLREGVANYALSGDAAAQRFRGVTRRVYDLTLARNERELQASEPAPALLFEGEPGRDHSVLQIGELVRGEAGGFALAPDYIPPCLALHAAPGLGHELHELLGRALTKRRRLAEERRARDGAKLDLTVRELEKSLFLHALDRSLAWLRHCSDTPETHPLTLYRALVDLAGALMTVALEGDPAELPAFRYGDLRATFAPLLAELRRLLGKEFDPVCVEVPLTIHQQSSWIGRLQDERLLHCQSFVLAVEVAGDLVVAATEIPEVTKVASWERITKIVQLNALGVPLRATFRPPPEVPVQPRTVYFMLDTGDQLWQELVAARKIAIYPRPPYEPQRARCRLFGIPAKEGER